MTQPIPDGAVATKDLMNGFRELDETAEAYIEASRYYTGEIPERFASAHIRQAIEAGGKRYRFRFAHIPVNVVKRRCQISAIRHENEAVTARIEEIRRANLLGTYEPWITEQWLVHGDGYVMTWPVETFADEDVAPTPLESAGVEISYQSPLGCRAFYDTEDGREMTYAIRRWREGGPLGKIWRAEIWYADRMEAFRTKPDASGSDPLDWERDLDAEGEWPMVNEFGEIPIKHLRTALPYGRPEHKDAYGPQDAITKGLVTQVTAGVESWGWAPRWRIADDSRALDVARDAVNWGDEADNEARATNPDGSARGVETSRENGPGTENVYRGTRAVGTYAVPDPGQLNDPLQMWVRFMSTATETPLYEFDPESGNQLSGVSREKADRPLNAKVADRRRALTTVWCDELWPLALRMVGIVVAEGIEIVWVPPEIKSDPEWWTTAQTRLLLGVPLRTILMEAGYQAEDVTTWLDSQAEESGLDQTIGRVKALGDAIASLGAGVTLGVITQQGAEALLKRIMRETATGSIADAFPDEAELAAREAQAQAGRDQGEDQDDNEGAEDDDQRA